MTEVVTITKKQQMLNTGHEVTENGDLNQQIEHKITNITIHPIENHDLVSSTKSSNEETGPQSFNKKTGEQKPTRYTKSNSSKLIGKPEYFEKWTHIQNNHSSPTNVEWDIHSIHSLDYENKKNPTKRNVDIRSIRSAEENQQWDIKSIYSADGTDSPQLGVTLKEESMKILQDYLDLTESNKRQSIQSSTVEVVTKDTPIDTVNLHIDHVKIVDAQLRSDPVVMEDQWTEYHSAPRQSSVTEVETKNKSRDNLNFHINHIEMIDDEARSTPVILEEKWTEYRREPVHSSIVEIENKYPLNCLNLHIDHITMVDDDARSIKSNSVILEEEWTEYRREPIHSATIERKLETENGINNYQKVSYIPTRDYETESIRSNSVTMEVPSYKSSVGKVFNHNRNSEIVTKPNSNSYADYYSYRYESPDKTEKLKDMTNIKTISFQKTSSLRNSKPPYPDTISKRHNPMLASTDCLKQTYQIDHEDEELDYAPKIYDAQGELIDNIDETSNFKSVTEYVTLKIYESKALIKIEIVVEMFHNTQATIEAWKRKNVRLTRMIELDLSKVKDSKRLHNIIERCNINQPPLYWTDENGQLIAQYNQENQLTEKDTFQIFAHLLAITHEEEERSKLNSSLHDDFYLTREPGGQITNVSCEPEYLLSRFKDNDKYLYY